MSAKQQTTVRTYILMGSNLDNPARQLNQAEKNIAKQIGKIRRRSSVYQTAAWGYRKQPDFLNRVLVVDTTLSAEKMMTVLLEIEAGMGRVRSKKNAARTIDLDILFYGKAVISTAGLTVPHPRMSVRRFVLVPLNQLSPMFRHPVSGQTIHQMLLSCPDELNVKKI